MCQGTPIKTLLGKLEIIPNSIIINQASHALVQAHETTLEIASPMGNIGSLPNANSTISWAILQRTVHTSNSHMSQQTVPQQHMPTTPNGLSI